jgi:hypothetical protein
VYAGPRRECGAICGNGWLDPTGLGRCNGAAKQSGG